MPPTTPETPAWRTRYGPQQMRELLGLTEWQYHRAMTAGVLPRPDAGGGKFSGVLARQLYADRIAIRRHAGTVPDVGADRAAAVLADRLGIDVTSDAVHELGRRGLLLVVDFYKD